MGGTWKLEVFAEGLVSIIFFVGTEKLITKRMQITSTKLEQMKHMAEHKN